MKQFSTSLFILGFLFVTSTTAHAIITRHDVPDANYIVADSDFPAIVTLFEPDDCLGTLVHESYLVTVAHCAADLDVGDSLNINGAAHAVSQIIPHPRWDEDEDDYDIALVRLSEPVKTVTPLPLYEKSDEMGATITLLGRGVHATGLKGEPGARSDGLLRRATNTISSVSKHFIEVYFNRPEDKKVTAFEGVGASGDSGGPAFIYVDGAPHIAGLNSWGEGTKDIAIGQYGSVDNQTRVSTYIDWLNSILIK